MENAAREQAIRDHLAAHEAKVARRRKARLSADNQKKKRGLDAAIASLKLKEPQQ